MQAKCRWFYKLSTRHNKLIINTLNTLSAECRQNGYNYFLGVSTKRAYTICTTDITCTQLLQKTDRDTSPIAPPCHETNHTKKHHINHSTPYIDEALQTSLQKHQTLRCAFGLGLRANTCSSHTKSARCNCPAQSHWWRRHSRPLCHHCRRAHQQQRQGGLCHYTPRWQTLHQGQQHFGGDNGY